MTDTEKHRQESTLGVDAWVETTEQVSESEGFTAAAKMLAGDSTSALHPQHSVQKDDSK